MMSGRYPRNNHDPWEPTYDSGPWTSRSDDDRRACRYKKKFPLPRYSHVRVASRYNDDFLPPSYNNVRVSSRDNNDFPTPSYNNVRVASGDNNDFPPPRYSNLRVASRDNNDFPLPRYNNVRVASKYNDDLLPHRYDYDSPPRQTSRTWWLHRQHDPPQYNERPYRPRRGRDPQDMQPLRPNGPYGRGDSSRYRTRRKQTPKNVSLDAKGGEPCQLYSEAPSVARQPEDGQQEPSHKPSDKQLSLGPQTFLGQYTSDVNEAYLLYVCGDTELSDSVMADQESDRHITEENRRRLLLKDASIRCFVCSAHFDKMDDLNEHLDEHNTSTDCDPVEWGEYYEPISSPSSPGSPSSLRPTEGSGDFSGKLKNGAHKRARHFPVSEKKNKNSKSKSKDEKRKNSQSNDKNKNSVNTKTSQSEDRLRKTAESDESVSAESGLVSHASSRGVGPPGSGILSQGSPAFLKAISELLDKGFKGFKRNVVFSTPSRTDSKEKALSDTREKLPESRSSADEKETGSGEKRPRSQEASSISLRKRRKVDDEVDDSANDKLTSETRDKTRDDFTLDSDSALKVNIPTSAAVVPRTAVRRPIAARVGPTVFSSLNENETFENEIERQSPRSGDAQNETSETCSNTISETCKNKTSETCNNTTSETCNKIPSDTCNNKTSETCNKKGSESYNKKISETCDNTTSETCNNTTSESCDSTTSETCDNTTSESYDNTTSETCGNTTSESCDSTTSETCDNTTSKSCDNTTSKSCVNTTSETCDNTTSESCDNTTSKSCDNTTSESCKNTTPEVHQNGQLTSEDVQSIIAFYKKTKKSRSRPFFVCEICETLVFRTPQAYGQHLITVHGDQSDGPGF